MKTWQGRFQQPSSRGFEAFTSSIEQDRLLAPYDVRVSIAHAAGLKDAGLLTLDEYDRLVEGLNAIGADLQSGTLEWRDELEDVHTHVESWLRERVGDVASRLHAGRSRNDQIAADLRLYVVQAATDMRDLIRSLQRALLDLADRHRTAVMPGYTHLQQAQPVVIAYPLLAYVAMLDRDHERLAQLSRRADRSPLGSGALAGSTFPLDRQLLAREVGLGEPIEVALDAVSDRDFLVEFVFACALCQTHLSRLAEDFILWASSEFRFLKLPDAFASGSSMMPQKKNPDVFELVRGRSALVVGDVVAALTLVKGIPISYNRDLQEDKTPVFHASQTAQRCLLVLADMAPALQFDEGRCRSAISSLAGATDLADHLVRRGIAFREAHGAVGKAVSQCIATGKELSDISVSDLGLSEDFEPLPDLSPEACVARKATAGSTNPEEVARLIAEFSERINQGKEGTE